MRPRRLALAAILLVALAARVGYLVHVTRAPGFVWDDPDSYLAEARALAGEGTDDGWRFSFQAVAHGVEGRRYALPPLYPVFLSLFATLPGFPFTAQLAQALLATLGVYLVYLLGRRLHSERAGLLAAAVWALWLPNVIAVWSTMQEALYVPLALVAFALFFRGVDRRESVRGLALAGAAFGLAALTRSMPLYFVPVAAAALFALERRTARALALVAGFLLPTVPYSVALSMHLSEPTFIENHGGLRIAARYGEDGSDRPPGVVTTALTLGRAFAEAPGAMASEWERTARSILHVNGGRLLQIYLGSSTRTGAALSKLAAHVLGDGLFVLALLLAPVGAALCRRFDLALFFLLWIAVHLGLTTLSGFGGARLRAPFEPHLVVLAAVPLAGALTVRRRALVPALALSALGALVVLPQLPASLQASGDYGVDWTLDRLPKRSAMTGRAGMSLYAARNAVALTVRPRNPAGRTVLELSLNGEPVERVVVDGEHRFRAPWPRLELVYAELEAFDEATGAPVRALVIVPAR